jgi:hypothetical protein|tara:strand:- start:22 stop:522 length:501 start_codon:yes stop_codon:yes gene_type:complete
MDTQSGNGEMTPDEVVMTPDGVVVKHADHGLDESHLRQIDTILKEQPGGFFIDVYDLFDDSPDLMSALYGPMVGDNRLIEHEVFYEVRNGRPGPSRLVNRPCRPCRRMVVCGIKGIGESSVIFTAYGTQAFLPAPREVWDSSQSPNEVIQSAIFWFGQGHALSSQA